MIEVESIVKGGETLQEHSADPAVAQRIADGNWTHVVLQGQSLEFAKPEPAAKLGKLIVAAGATPTWYVTWARAPSSDEYSLPNSNVFYSSANEMQDFATYSYVQALMSFAFAL